MEYVQCIGNIVDELDIGLELTGGDTADRSHKSFFSDKCIGGRNDIVGTLDDMGCDLEVGKAGVVHQIQRRLLRLNPFHISDVKLEIRLFQFR